MTQPGETGPPPPKPSPLIENWISLIGVILAGNAFFAAITLITIDLTWGFGTPYVGILTYIVTPVFLIAGLALTVVGILIEYRRRQHLGPGEHPRRPRIDLNIPRHRKMLAVTLAVTFVFLVITGVGTYQSYHFTESVTFCGQTCHTVMKPEFTAYQTSPHARVACVQCHIGPGAGWFVKSKLSGAYQVYATIANKYPRPIPAPIEHLRPAQDVCEQCHWPEKFYGNAERLNYHFLSDSANSPWHIQLLMKVGGSDPDHGQAEGIHWHTDIAAKVEYIPTDSLRQRIPWIRVTGRDGQVTVYQSEADALTPAQVDSAEIRTMDCIDCHNQPSHIYRAPQRSVNLALGTGRIDPKIPYIKKTAVGLLTATYDSTPQAVAAIERGLRDAYRTYSDAAAIEQAMSTIRTIYINNFFPEMRVNWRAYPSNVGHLLFPGCFRCHDGTHKSQDGRSVSHSCTSCHIIIAQGPAGADSTIAPGGLEFQHPVDIGGMWRTVNCDGCHAGG